MAALQQSDLRDLLAQNQLFSNLSPSCLDPLISLSRTANYSAQQAIFNQGDVGSEMYILLAGQVEVAVILSNGDRFALTTLNAGDSFGEIALFDQRRRTASVSTTQPSEFFVIQRDRFVTFLMSNPDVAVQLLNVFAKQISTTNDLMKDTLYTNITSRLAKTLNNIAHAYGWRTRKGLKIDGSFTYDELGKIAGLSREIVAAHLKDWQQQGLLDLERGYITILDEAELKNLE